jgi:RNA polymerase sigma factor (sigma-70 family)
MVAPATDDQLMNAVREGAVDQLAVLFERHHRALFQFFTHLTGSAPTAEDLLQEVFFRILKFRHTYRPDRSYTAWMYQIARNVHVDHLRRKRPELPFLEREDEVTWEPRDTAPMPDARFERQSEMVTLRRALAQLPADKREVLILSRYQNLKYEEIAQILNCEVGAVKQRVFRAVRQLSEIFFRLSGRRTA